MAYSTGFRKLERRLSQLTRVMYAVWEKMGAKIRMGKQHRLVQTRMLAGVVRVPGNGHPYPIYPTVLVVLYAVPHFKQCLSAMLTVRTVYPQLGHCRT